MGRNRSGGGGAGGAAIRSGGGAGGDVTAPSSAGASGSGELSAKSQQIISHRENTIKDRERHIATLERRINGVAGDGRKLRPLTADTRQRYRDEIKGIRKDIDLDRADIARARTRG